MLAKNTIQIICLSIFFTLGLSACHSESSKPVKVGIVVPLEHKAMQEIVAGVTEYLYDHYQQPLVVKVKNAQGDANLQRAILQQMQDEDYQIIVPIGTTTTQMALTIVDKQPIVSLASKLTDRDRKIGGSCHAVFVHDEISPEQLIAFIHSTYPDIKTLALIHSTSEKVLPEVQSAIVAGAQYGMDVKHLMVTSLPDLYSVGKSLPQNTQAIFILKDNLIASGISTLAKIAHEKNIPLIASDEGSVKNGADVALGVFEKQIGIEGAKLIFAILSGKPACSLPVIDMKNLTVFINSKIKNKKSIERTAKKNGYSIQTTAEG